MLSLINDVDCNTNVSIFNNGKNIFNVKYGDILNISCHANNIIVIPYYHNGTLLKLFDQKNISHDPSFIQSFETDNEIDICFLGKSVLPNIKHAIYLRYENDINEPQKLFYKILKFMDNKNIINGANLYLSTFGVNNGIRYYNVSLTLFYGIKSHIIDDLSLIHKLNNITVMVPFDNGKNKSIIYLMSLVTYFNKTLNENDCIICLENKAVILLSCGHRILCYECMKKIKRDNNICPLCRKFISYFCECIQVIKIDNKCCENNKLQLICLPCCHYNTACSSCDINDTCYYCHLSAKKYVYYDC